MTIPDPPEETTQFEEIDYDELSRRGQQYLIEQFNIDPATAKDAADEYFRLLKLSGEITTQKRRLWQRKLAQKAKRT